MTIDTWLKRGHARVAQLLARVAGALTLGLTAPEMSLGGAG